MKKSTKGDILNLDGTLKEATVQTVPNLSFNREDVKKKGKLKEWETYYISDNRYGLIVSLCNLSYAAVLSASVVDFGKNISYNKTSMAFWPKNKDFMSHSIFSGVSAYHTKDADLSFETKGGKRLLSGNFNNFFKEGASRYDLNFEIELDEYPDEHLVRTASFKKNWQFLFNQKINCVRAFGRFTVKERTYKLGDAAMATLDWGRGVLPRNNLWYWASLEHVVKGDLVGLNLGRGFGEGEGQNMLFINGQGYKLDDVRIYIRHDNLRHDYLRTWTFYSNDGRVELMFEPDQDRHNGLNKLICWHYPHQVFGHFNGKINLEDGKVIELDDVPGFAMRVLSHM